MLENVYQNLENVLANDSLWMLEVFVVVFLTLVIAFFAKRFIQKLTVRAEQTKNLWDDALINAIARPLNIFIWVIGLSFAASIASQAAGASIFSYVETARDIAAVFIVVWFINNFIRGVEVNVIKPGYLNKPMDKTTAVAISKLLRISVIISAVLIVIQSLGYSISGVLAFGGIGGIAVGFAAKDLLANFFGGLMIYLDRPFAVGDWIRSPDKDIEGTVEDIGWRLTTIRTFDKRPLYVPNSTFTVISVENPSRMKNRRIKETIGVRYDDASKIAAIVDDVKTMILHHDAIDTQQTTIVNFNQCSASSLDFFIYCFTKTTNWVEFHGIKQDVMLNVLTIIESHGAECAFPTSTIHLADSSLIEKNGAH